MLCSVLVHIDQQGKVMNNFCLVSENIIFSNLKVIDFFKKSILVHFQAFKPLRSMGGGVPKP